MTLYEIGADWNRVMDFELENEGDQEAFLSLLDEVEGAFVEKAERVCMVMKNVEAEAEAFKAEEARLAGRRKALENKADRLKSYLAGTMKAMGLPEQKTPLFSLKFQKNPPAVEVLDPAAIPADYWRQPEPVLDRALVKKALAEGYEIPGARLVQGESLRIR